jgi:hypothetical protein
MYHKPMLEILEVEYSVSPGGVDEFEVYSLHEEDVMNPPLFTTTDLLEAVQFCYSLGKDFVVRTLAEWEERQMLL